MDSTWNRNATGVAGFTPYAMPAMLTGKYPDRSRSNAAPVAQVYRDNLFSLLGRFYDLKVFETVTQLCPPAADHRRPDRRQRSLEGRRLLGGQPAQAHAHGQGVYRTPAEIGTIGGAGVTVKMKDWGRFKQIDPASTTVPALVVGQVTSGTPPKGAVMVVTVNGRIAGTAGSYAPRDGCAPAAEPLLPSGCRSSQPFREQNRMRTGHAHPKGEETHDRALHRCRLGHDRARRSPPVRDQAQPRPHRRGDGGRRLAVQP